jgi:hypothetical protein
MTAVGIALLAVMGTALLPGSASALRATDNPSVIYTHRVIGALVGPGTMGGAPGLIGTKRVTTHRVVISPNLVIAHGARVTKSTGAVPLIEKQPSNLSVKAGARTSFVATAKGSPTPAVQWKESSNGKAWKAIKGATKSTYTFVASGKMEGYRFEAVFKTAAGSVTTHFGPGCHATTERRIR